MRVCCCDSLITALFCPFEGLPLGSPAGRSSHQSVPSCPLANTPLSVCRSVNSPLLGAPCLPPRCPETDLTPRLSLLLKDGLGEAVIGPAMVVKVL